MSFILQVLFFVSAILLLSTNFFTLREYYKSRDNTDREYPIKWRQLLLTSFLAIGWILSLLIKWI